MSTINRLSSDKASSAQAIIRQYRAKVTKINQKELSLRKKGERLSNEDLETRANCVREMANACQYWHKRICQPSLALQTLIKV